MSKVVRFRKKEIDSDRKRDFINHTIQGTQPQTFMNEVEKDTNNLAMATGKSHEEAMKIASDFYRRYPMLVEYVRSPDYLFRNR